MKKYCKIACFLFLGVVNITCKTENIQTQLDPTLEFYLVNGKYDSDGKVNGKISEKDADRVVFLYITGPSDPDRRTVSYPLITSLRGIEQFVNLQTIYVEDMSTFKDKSVDFTQNVRLKDINLNNISPALEEIELSKNYRLESLYLDKQLRSSTLSFPMASNIPLKKITLHNFMNVSINWNLYNTLELLSLNNCKIDKIDVTKLVKLQDLEISKSNILAIDISKNIDLKTLTLEENDLSSLDISNNLKLERLDCYSVYYSKLLTVCIAPNQTIKYLYKNNFTVLKVCNNN